MAGTMLASPAAVKRKPFAPAGEAANVVPNSRPLPGGLL